MKAQTKVWARHASQWGRVGFPLKPGLEDAELMRQMLGPIFTEQDLRARIAVLGVTPELIQWTWPPQVEIRAFDHSPEMIARVWQPHPTVASSVREADWRKLPLADGSVHAIVGDGSFNVLPSLDDYALLLRELQRVSSPAAMLVVRFFIRPAEPEMPQRIVDDVVSGRLKSFHALKWRIAMALTDTASASIPVEEIWQAFQRYFPSRQALAHMTSWPMVDIDTIDAYEGASTRYTFPTLSQLQSCCQPYFDIETIRYPGYELGHCCPTLALRRRASASLGA